MTILHYIPTISALSGGIGTYMQLLARDLGRLCTLHVITHMEEQLLELENCMVHYISQPTDTMDYFKLLTSGGGYRKEFLTVLDEVHPDLVHVNTCWLPLCAKVSMWAKESGYKVVFSPHGMLEPYIMRRNYWMKKVPAILLYQKKAVQIADMVHVTAQLEKKTVLDLGWNDKLEIIANSVQSENIVVKDDWKRKHSILFLSRLHVKKGLEYLIRACSQLKSELSGYTVSIVGPGEVGYVSGLKNMAQEMGVDDIVQFALPAFGSGKWQLYQNADVFVLPTHSENFGIVVAEALASGTPVITTHGTPWEEIEQRNCGWWIPVGTEALVKALREFLKCSDEELRKKGLNGRQLIEEKYSSTSIAQQFINMYEKI